MSEKPKKVLIITYYWPPSGGVGVLRWLKFSKYLPEFGWEPIIYTPENPDFENKDPNLLKDIPSDIKVLKTKIWEPFYLFRAFSSKKGDKKIKQGVLLDGEKKSLFKKMSFWLRANLFLPDPRVFWVLPSVKFLTDYLKNNQVDVIVTTGPPHSMHLIGYNIKKIFPEIKWLADFRDPWSNWDINNELKPSELARKHQLKWEQRVLKTADMVSSIGPRICADFEKLGNRAVIELNNGFDSTDFSLLDEVESQTTFFEISHFGILGELRNPDGLWEALEELCQNTEFKQKLRINLAGSVSSAIIEQLSKSVLSDNLVYNDYLDHQSVLKKYKDSSLLLLLLNKTDNAPWIMPVKMFEFYKVGKPILMLGPKESDAADVLIKTEAGLVYDHHDKVNIKQFIWSVYTGNYHVDLNRIIKETGKFERRNVTAKLASILDNKLIDEK